MSDERLRELERRWKESGTVEDEAAYLLERVRAGVLGANHLALARTLGHPAAQVGDKQGGLVDLDEWAKLLEPEPLSTVLAVALGIARGAPAPASPHIDEALELVDRVRRGETVCVDALIDARQAVSRFAGQVSGDNAKGKVWTVHRAVELTLLGSTSSPRVPSHLIRAALSSAIHEKGEPDSIRKSIAEALLQDPVTRGRGQP